MSLLTRYLNQFQTLWKKYKATQTNALALQLAEVLVDITNEFVVNQTPGYRTLMEYREKYGIDRQDPVINPMNETVEDNLAVSSPTLPNKVGLNMPAAAVAVAAPIPGASVLPVTTTPYSGIYAKKCIDPLLFDSQNIDLTTAILHIVGNTGKKITHTYCLDTDSIKGYLGDLSMVFYQCKPSVPKTAIMIRPESVFPTKIRRLPFEYAVYVYESEIQQIKPGKQYVLIPTEKAVGRIASHTVIAGGSVVSAQHCQNDYTQDFIYSVSELGELPTQTESAKKRQLAAEVAEEAANYVTKRAVTRAAKSAASKLLISSKGSKSPKSRRTRRMRRN